MRAFLTVKNVAVVCKKSPQIQPWQLRKTLRSKSGFLLVQKARSNSGTNRRNSYCTTTTLQAGDGGIIFSEMFPWSTVGSLICPEITLNTRTYLIIVADWYTLIYGYNVCWRRWWYLVVKCGFSEGNASTVSRA